MPVGLLFVTVGSCASSKVISTRSRDGVADGSEVVRVARYWMYRPLGLAIVPPGATGCQATFWTSAAVSAERVSKETLVPVGVQASEASCCQAGSDHQRGRECQGERCKDE